MIECGQSVRYFRTMHPVAESKRQRERERPDLRSSARACITTSCPVKTRFWANEPQGTRDRWSHVTLVLAPRGYLPQTEKRCAARRRTRGNRDTRHVDPKCRKTILSPATVIGSWLFAELGLFITDNSVIAAEFRRYRWLSVCNCVLMRHSNGRALISSKSFFILSSVGSFISRPTHSHRHPAGNLSSQRDALWVLPFKTRPANLTISWSRRVMRKRNFHVQRRLWVSLVCVLSKQLKFRVASHGKHRCTANPSVLFWTLFH